MKKILTLAVVSALIVCSVIGAGCTSANTSLVGKWTDDKGLYTFYFIEDGTLVLQSKSGNNQYGYWEVYDGSFAKDYPNRYQYRLGKRTAIPIVLSVSNDGTTLTEVISTILPSGNPVYYRVN